MHSILSINLPKAHTLLLHPSSSSLFSLHLNPNLNTIILHTQLSTHHHQALYQTMDDKEEVESSSRSRWDGYVDWRGKPALRGTHGGITPAFFVLVVEVLENLAYLASASNLVLYLTHYMHFSPSESANAVTNFMGTAFLLALLGGFFSDAFLTTYRIYLISAATEFLGLVILTVQAQSASLKPPKCDNARPDIPCQQVHGAKAALLFLGLYLVALGVGGIKGSLPAHGAEQFDEDTPQGRKQRSTFFNYFVFALSCGALIAVTLVVWIEDNMGWQWGFGVSTLIILLSVPIFLGGSTFYRNKVPLGSPLTTICKVLIASVLNTFTPRSSSNAIASMATSPSPNPLSEEIDAEDNIKVSESCESPSDSLNFPNRAVVRKPGYAMLKCSVQQVEEVKTVVRILPIFACTIVLNCCLAQLSTFSVQQAATMNTKLGSLNVPPASLPVFPVVFIMILAPLYDHVIIPFARRVTKSEMGISHLQRIGIGLVLSIIAMAVAAVVEVKRKRVATNSGLLDSTKPLPVTFLWIAFQYLFLGSADLFTLAGLLEFFFTEAPFSMRSLATSLSFASLAMGYYLSTVIVSIVNGVTGGSRHKPWLSGSNLNDYHLDRFYWLLCSLSGLNFMQYLFWATRYKYRSTQNKS
ncbi:protein NRT1/ PTR FAMILY 4.6 isoform X2 [Sesamum indicum]|uniref:Protein NRT1/ PTR FAMILY 4.6 isoform X2 n=1 Tax=Sesamum indicum TaxID=4182 RepID=A0A6I9TP83_SESIN|nr:protein NRT1/ PTR FAMILY 4.6 isoform X2 [Sesamum indicum]